MNIDLIYVVLKSRYSMYFIIKQFRKYIQNNWSILTDNREIDIMHKYTNFGKLSTIFITTITGIATESFTLANAIHIFGMFKIASYRMEHMLKTNALRIPVTKSYKIFYDKIIAAVDIHRRALEFSELLQASFGLSYLFMLTVALFSATASLFRLFRILTMEEEKLELIKFLLYVLFIFLFLIAGNFVGQEFTDCDNHIHRIICNTQWYDAPLKIQKFILFLIRKTTKSYRVKAAGMFSPSLEGFTTAMSLIFSFLTLLCSLH
ncbi:hypothetical protein P5V15_004451 [Pogonomyrmex californicus]